MFHAACSRLRISVSAAPQLSAGTEHQHPQLATGSGSSNSMGSRKQREGQIEHPGLAGMISAVDI